MHCTKPDIAFTMCKLSRFTSKPSTMHWKAIVRVLGFLKRTEDLGIFYRNFPAVLEGFTYASWVTSATGNKPTSGWIFTLGGAAISWASKSKLASHTQSCRLSLYPWWLQVRKQNG